MTIEFTDFNLQPALTQALTELGYTTPTPIQSGMIPLMLSGVDVIGQAQTGTGKTAAFALPILNNYQPRSTAAGFGARATRELALQVAEAIQGYGRHSAYRCWRFMAVKVLASRSSSCAAASILSSARRALARSAGTQDIGLERHQDRRAR